MVGTSSAVAPCTASRSLITPAWSLVRGTSTRQPYRARDSHHDSRSRCSTAAPIVTTSGPSRSPPSPASDASVVCTVFCAVRVPLGGDGDRRGRGDAVLGQARRRRRPGAPTVACSTSGPGRGGERRPVDTPPARPPRRARSRAGHRRRPARRCRRRRPGRRRTARLAAATATRLGHDRVGGQRVAADQPHDRPARGRLGDQAGGDVGRLADGGPDLGAVGHEGEHALGDVGVGDHQRGAGDRVAGPDGEQSGVAGAAAHEGDASGGGRCAVHRSTPD